MNYFETSSWTLFNDKVYIEHKIKTEVGVTIRLLHSSAICGESLHLDENVT